MKIASLAFGLALMFRLDVNADDIPPHVGLPPSGMTISIVERSDLALFFDRISFQGDQWEFRFAPNAEGATFRIQDGHSNVADTAHAGAAIDLFPGSSLEVKAKDREITFVPHGSKAFEVHLLIPPDAASKNPGVKKDALLTNGPNGIELAPPGMK